MHLLRIVSNLRYVQDVVLRCASALSLFSLLYILCDGTESIQVFDKLIGMNYGFCMARSMEFFTFVVRMTKHYMFMPRLLSDQQDYDYLQGIGINN